MVPPNWFFLSFSGPYFSSPDPILVLQTLFCTRRIGANFLVRGTPALFHMIRWFLLVSFTSGFPNTILHPIAQRVPHFKSSAPKIHGLNLKQASISRTLPFIDLPQAGSKKIVQTRGRVCERNSPRQAGLPDEPLRLSGSPHPAGRAHRRCAGRRDELRGVPPGARAQRRGGNGGKHGKDEEITVFVFVWVWGPKLSFERSHVFFCFFDAALFKLV